MILFNWVNKQVTDSKKLIASVPPEMEPLFLQAQERVEEYFNQVTMDAPEGILRLGGNRHLMLRGDALGFEFFKLINSIYGESSQTNDIANALLFDLSHAIGAADANKFIKTMGLTDPIEKLAVGPIYFAHAGFAKVIILPESNPSPDDDFVLFYRHKNSFEAESWISKQKPVEQPICILSTGYSSGWCSTAFDIPLIAVEYNCEATGDEHCEFVMAPPHRIQHYLDKKNTRKHSLYVPSFFGRIEHEEHLQTLAHRDTLTNLSNRVFFTEMGNKLLQLNSRNNLMSGLLFLDLDGFKKINDAHGHATGDHVLKTVAERIPARLRESDLTARLGGDEFAILIQEINGYEALSTIAQNLIDTINETITFNDIECHVGVSIGGAFFTSEKNITLEKLLCEADNAMYEAKKAGKNDYVIKRIHKQGTE